MSGPGNFLFFTGLFMFAIGLILIISLSKEHRKWWMWFLLFLGLFLLIWGAILWFASGVISNLNSQGGGSFQGGQRSPGEEAEAGEAEGAGGEAGLLGELGEAAIFL